MSISRKITQNIETGNPYSAFELVKMIQPKVSEFFAETRRYIRARTLKAIAVAQAEAGDYLAALETADKIDSELVWWQVRTYGHIAKVAAQMGFADIASVIFDAAEGISETYMPFNRGTADQIQNPTPHNVDVVTEDTGFTKRFALAEAMSDVAAAMAEVGLFDRAVAFAQKIDHSYGKVIALTAIATRQVDVGKLDAARSALTLAEHVDLSDCVERHVDLALAMLAETHTHVGDWNAARQTLQHIENDNLQMHIEKSVLAKEILTGEATDAIALAQQAQGEKRRAHLLEAVAVAQIQTGQPDQALRTGERILVDRGEHLSKIAVALLIADDYGRFQQLLIPCAYYRNAVVELCKVILQIFPGQIMEVVDFFLSDQYSTQ